VKADRPIGVTAVAAVFLLVAVYLLGVALAMLVKPGFISMAAGADLLSGLEIAGPFMFLLIAVVSGAIALGLLHLQNWARRVAIVVAMIGAVRLLPSVSGAVVDFRFAGLVWGGLGIIVRTMIAFYLYQEPVANAFPKGPSSG
jgi:multidrug transporter EmrE-like cation transporter